MQSKLDGPANPGNKLETSSDGWSDVCPLNDFSSTPGSFTTIVVFESPFPPVVHTFPSAEGIIVAVFY